MTDISNKSYVSVEEADNRFQYVVGGQSWLSLNLQSKEAALVQASQLLDSNFDWFGDILTETQNLRWPRKNVLNLDKISLDGIVPIEIKMATMDLANYLVKAGGINLIPNNLDSLKVGPITLDFEKVSTSNDQLIPKAIVRSLDFLGSYRGPSNTLSAYNVEVIRS